MPTLTLVFQYVDESRRSLDELTYTMTSSTKNLLDKVVDNVTAAASTYTNDLDETQTSGNYAYDAIGNLTKDVAAGIAANGIVWTPYGKIKQVTNATYRIEYLYDAMGNRVRQKRVKLSDNSYVTTYYGRDASGKNLVGTYEKIDTGSTVLKEVPLYGSSRLGILRPNATQSTTAITPPTVYTRTLGKKEYEITDHLGNVRVSVSDRLVKPGADWRNDVKMQTDYFPFGMQREDHNDNVAGYRYGYNGKENDNDVKGEGDQIDYGARAYDPRLARWLSRDPLASKYPNVSPYVMTGNSPILFAELDGRDYGIKINHEDKTITVYADYAVVEGTEASLQQGLDEWMRENGKFRYDVDVNGTTASYQVVFELKVVGAENADYTRPVNRFRVLSGHEFERHPAVMGRNSAGFNSFDEIVLNEEYSSSSVTGVSIKKHEIGHNLGADHASETVMDPRMEQGRPKGFKPVLTVSPSIIEDMLGQAGLGPKRGQPQPNDARGILVEKKEQGSAPKYFESGSVKEND